MRLLRESGWRLSGVGRPDVGDQDDGPVEAVRGGDHTAKM
jgi:hypothetical protein